MEKNEKKCQVWMLPTDKAYNVPFLRNINGRGNRLYPATKGYYYTQAYLKEQQFEANHLYITSDDEIKEGDWFIFNEEIKQLLRSKYSGSILVLNEGNGSIYGHNIKDCKKIIATTDKFLTISEVIYPEELIHPLPQPSESFIQKYIECYNKGEVIKEVMVKYNTFIPNDKFDAYISKVRINPKDNTITIRKIKDNWNREEVIELVTNAFHEGSSATDSVGSCNIIQLYKWIENNL